MKPQNSAVQLLNRQISRQERGREAKRAKDAQALEKEESAQHKGQSATERTERSQKADWKGADLDYVPARTLKQKRAESKRSTQSKASATDGDVEMAVSEDDEVQEQPLKKLRGSSSSSSSSKDKSEEMADD